MPVDLRGRHRKERSVLPAIHRVWQVRRSFRNDTAQSRIRLGTLLVLQQPLRGGKPPAVPGEGPVSSDDTMAWHDDRDRVSPVGETDGPTGFRVADATS